MTSRYLRRFAESDHGHEEPWPGLSNSNHICGDIADSPLTVRRPRVQICFNPYEENCMRYQLKQIHCRPWTLSGLSLKLIESHYENNYGGALRRLNAITEQLESLDFAKTPGYVVNGLKREELVALNSTLLHELYFASLGGDGRVTNTLSEALARDFGSVQRWRTEFSAMGYALGG